MEAVYLMFLRLPERNTLEVGALGDLEFEPGTYIYVGSAMNSVEKRLERHFSQTGNKHWHIDYFSGEAEPFDYFILPEDSRYEEWLAEKLEGFCEPVSGFGSSDSSRNSHLFRVPESEDF